MRAGARLARSVQQQQPAARSLKPDRSPVTLADFAVQALVARQLMDAFPADQLVAEERAEQIRQPEVDRMERPPGTPPRLEALVGLLQDHWPQVTSDDVVQWIGHGAGKASGRFWTLDPVDGTKGFLRGEQYVVALALIEQGQVMLGALGCPNLNTNAEVELGGAGAVAWAVRGSGAWIEPLEGGEPKRLAVSDIHDRTRARVLRSAAAEHTNLSQLDQLERRLGLEVEPVLMDSQAKYVVLAAGNAELIFRLLSPDQPEYRERIWDQAAGSLLVQEAGGRVTDLDGRALDFSAGRQLTNNRGVLVSNGRLHDLGLQTLQQVGA